MTIDRLCGVVPPPQNPAEAFQGPWDPVEAQLGTRLPPDYKEFVRLYGSGYFMEFLGVGVPSVQNVNVRLEAKVPAVSDVFRAMDGGLPKHPYRYWPEPGGLIPFGSTDNGDYLLWLPDGAPEQWKVVVWDRGGDFEVFDCDLTDFLAGVATGAIRPKAFPDDVWPGGLLFQPRGSSA